MAPDPAPPPVILAIPAPSPPPNPSSPSPNHAPPSIASDLSSSPPDPACHSPVLAPPPPVISVPASAAPACQQLCEDQARLELPADLLCFQSFLSPSISVESPPDQGCSAASEPPPAAPTVSVAFPPLPSSSSKCHHPADAPLPAHPTDIQSCSDPARQNASVTTVTELLPAVPPETAAPLPPLFSSPPMLPHHVDAPLPAQPSDLQQRAPPVRRNAQVNPPQLKSYAQAAKGSPGPGFVRAHARDVDSFARLPRTGINVICGTREGIPVFSLVQSDMHKVEGLYDKALVMKFHGGRPSLAASHKEISGWGLECPFSIGPLTSRSLLLRFQDERDLLKILTRPSSTLISFPYKIFRWHSRCHKNEDSVSVPVWISLPGLPLQCFAPEFLESIANRIGRFLCLDKATATLARPSTARMCIELDMREARPQYVWIDLFEGHKQTIVYERVPKFCSCCHVQGHTNVNCSKASLDSLQNTDSGPSSDFQKRAQTVQHNAKNNSAVVPQVIPIQSRTSSAAATAANLSASYSPQQDPPDPSQQQLQPPSISPVILSAPIQQAPLAAATSLQSISSVAAALHQLCDPLPHPPPPSKPLLPAAAQQLPAVQPDQCPTAAAPYPPLQQSAGSGELHPPCSVSPSSAYAPLSAAPFPAVSVSPFTSDPPQQLPAVRPNLQSTIAAATHPPLPTPPSIAEAISSSYPCHAATVPPTSQDQCPAAAVPHLASDPPSSSAPHPPPEVQQVVSRNVQDFAADPTPVLLPVAAVYPDPTAFSAPCSQPEVQQVDIQTGQAFAAAPIPVLSAQAAPFCPSDPVQSVQQTSSLNDQHSTSPLRFYYNIHGAKCMTMPSRPCEMVNRQQSNQGHLSSIIHAPSPSYNHHQFHALEGYDSEGSFETDSQPNSPLESSKEDANKRPFLPQSCTSEGEQPTEDHPGFQGHISDVEFYRRPMSSKKNKRQPDGPLRVQLRTRKGPSMHK